MTSPAPATLGCVIKLLAICERCDGGVSARVYPAMIPRVHPLAAVREAYNAVFVEAESAGRLMFYGAGAGGQPTASAVLGDIVTVVRNRLAGLRGPDASTYAELPLVPIGDVLTRYFVQLDVADRPGVLAPVADAFAQQGVSIKAMRQEGRGEDANAADRHAHRKGRGAVQDGGRAQRDARGAGGGQRDAGRGRGRGVTEGTRRAWRGLIDEYADWLPAAGARPGGIARRGRHAAAGRARPVGQDRLPGLPQDRGRQPDRVVQGPGHDRRGEPGRQARRHHGDLRVHRQHQRQRRRLRRQGRA